MFCLQCGAEAPARAVTCSVCGHDLGRSSADLRSSIAMVDTPIGAGVTLGSPVQEASARPVGTSVSIHAGDLDQPGLPQDATGRALLIVVLALVADLFLPWSVVSTQHQTLPVATGLAISLLIGLAALPLAHPMLRRYTITAAVPMVVGGMCLGIGIAFWANLGSTSSATSSAGPDFGLLVFLVGAALVVVIGYHLFLDSALVSLPSEAAAASARIPTRPTGMEQPQSNQVAPPAAAAAYSADKTIEPKSPKAVSIPEPVLPGSDSWNHTLEAPVFIRPRAGTIRRSNR